MPVEITVTCFCGKGLQKLELMAEEPPTSITLCHCNGCSSVTGLLCASYIPVVPPEVVDGLSHYSTTPSSFRYFCSTCGCHMYRSSHSMEVLEDPRWEVATGVIIESPDHPWVPNVRHTKSSEIKDRGLFPFLKLPRADKPGLPKPSGSTSAPELPETISAHCRCRRVSFIITRPSQASTVPNSDYPDLLLPYHSTPYSTIANPSSVKWWLRSNSPTANPPATDALRHPSPSTLASPPSDLRYLAGACACRSCRLSSGFEIQTWAFVPRANILYELYDRDDLFTLDFSLIPKNILKSYQSSDGGTREFCPGCGATVFWHDTRRPDIIDVSVGLLESSTGSRATDFLSWWTERVSFAEEVQKGRTGFMAGWAVTLIDTLENGLQTWQSQE
ncbi:hypothetical protein OQA88_4536 [Cercophora sp. LCS_1]